MCQDLWRVRPRRVARSFTPALSSFFGYHLCSLTPPSHSISLIGAQGVPTYKIGLGRGKNGRVEVGLELGGGSFAMQFIEEEMGRGGGT